MSKICKETSKGVRMNLFICMRQKRFKAKLMSSGRKRGKQGRGVGMGEERAGFVYESLMREK